jgi:hypothetical protein
MVDTAFLIVHMKTPVHTMADHQAHIIILTVCNKISYFASAKQENYLLQMFHTLHHCPFSGEETAVVERD